ncbi:hypothetical protein A0H81_10435 [Grifola frondosa]|uniref:Uncharacterized protein n=1 Tax=Grifola frondosa TaxID=5627 RepID=A0A1C7LXV3_GRIFR|nr:hypothetical protein A0H81_10435 [Grifola frondosa]
MPYQLRPRAHDVRQPRRRVSALVHARPHTGVGSSPAPSLSLSRPRPMSPPRTPPPASMTASLTHPTNASHRHLIRDPIMQLTL